jgi:hypothetical protein
MKLCSSELRKIIENGISTEKLNSEYDYSHITDMSGLMENSTITKCPTLDLTNVINMYSMFAGCIKLKEVTLLNTQNITSAAHTFHDCIELIKINGMDNKNSTYNMTSVFYMFSNCHALIKIPLFNFNSFKIIYYRNIFSKCPNIENINPYEFPKYDFGKLDNDFVK